MAERGEPKFHVLIVHAHPEPESFTAAMKDEAVRQFEALGCEVRVSDLYKKGFNPIASGTDFPVRVSKDYLVYAKEQRAAYTAGNLPDDIAGELELVQWSDLLVLNFPVFWFSVPAIMKGWIDRIFLAGPFYGGVRVYDHGGMTGKRAWITATLGGRKEMFGDVAVHGRLEDMFSPLLRGTLGYVGFEVLDPYFGFHVPYLTADARALLIQDFRNAVLNWKSRASLRMPKLEHFDERLSPLKATHHKGATGRPTRRL